MQAVKEEFFHFVQIYFSRMQSMIQEKLAIFKEERKHITVGALGINKLNLTGIANLNQMITWCIIQVMKTYTEMACEWYSKIQ